MKSFKNNIPGILVCLAIAVPAWAFGRLVPVIGGPVTAIVAGKLRVKEDTSDSGCISGLWS